MRWRSSRITGEISYFRNSIDDYIFRNPITEEEFDERSATTRTPSEEEDGHGESSASSNSSPPTAFFRASRGTPISSRRGFGARVGPDYVRGELRATNQPLPRIPPFRFRGGA